MPRLEFWNRDRHRQNMGKALLGDGEWPYVPCNGDIIQLNDRRFLVAHIEWTAETLLSLSPSKDVPAEDTFDVADPYTKYRVPTIKVWVQER